MTSQKVILFVISVFFLLAALISRPGEASTIPWNGMVITTDTVFTPGTYYLPNGISIGASNDEIADRLNISSNTVRTHVYNLYR